MFNLGGGIENVYTAIPGLDGAADTVTDTLVTPFGNLNLGILVAGIDAISALDPGDAFGALTSGLTEARAARPPRSTRWRSSACKATANQHTPNIPGPKGPGMFGVSGSGHRYRSSGIRKCVAALHCNSIQLRRLQLRFD